MAGAEVATASTIDGSRIKRVAVIGAGISGLQVARMLQEQGLSVDVFEKRRDIGGVWYGGYEGYGVQVKKHLYEFPDFPLPKDVEDYTSGERFLEYVKSYTIKHKLMPLIHLCTTVHSLERREDGQRGWTVTYKTDDPTHAEESPSISTDFDLVVVCTGMFSSPHQPEIPGRENFKGTILHSSDCSDMSVTAGKKVVLFGCGKSACDLSEVATKYAAETTTVFAAPHWPLPRDFLGLVPIEYLVFNRLGASLVPLYLRPGPIERAFHFLCGPLIWLIWRILEAGLTMQYHIPEVMHSNIPLEKDAFNGGSITSATYFPLVHCNKIKAERASISSLSENSVVLSNGKELPADVLILATGFKKTYPFLPPSVIQALDVKPDGHYLYRHILHPDVPDLAFVGSNITTFTSLTTAALQARWLSEVIRGKVVLPSHDDMVAELALNKKWKEAIVINRYNRAATINVHQLHYYDELVKDMGKVPRLKGNFVAEFFSPYIPTDYTDIVA